MDVDLDAALATLNEQERSAIVLCHLEGLSRSEAARALGCPEGTLSARLSRALEKLRKKLGKQPLAILASATVVMLPDSLPASTVGLVRHFQDGVLEERASPRTMDFYRKAAPMRLLDRFGPAITSVIAALLILTGATFGWRMINAQGLEQEKQEAKSQSPPTKMEGKRKEFSAAVEEIQGKVATDRRSSPYFELKISKREGAFGGGASSSPSKIFIMETVADGSMNHLIEGWPALGPFLKQAASDGRSSIVVSISTDAASRLDANQVVNLCKRAGFKRLDYRGPELFIARDGNANHAFGESVRTVAFQVDLAEANGELPDWTNGWGVLDGKVVRLKEQLKKVDPRTIAQLWGGRKGPAAGLITSLDAQPSANETATDLSDLAKRLQQRQETGGAGERKLGITKNNGKSHYLFKQSLDDSTVQSETNDTGAAVAFVDRLVRFEKGGRFDVAGGHESSDGKTVQGAIVDPLEINRLLNALKRSGADEINYSGQPLFTGPGADGKPYNFTKSFTNKPIVRMTLQPKTLDGELPDSTNGWTWIYRDDGYWVVRENERQKYDAALMSPLNAVEPSYAEEVLRLSKLTSEEVEKEIAKKAPHLRNRWRKSIEDVKAKPPAK